MLVYLAKGGLPWQNLPYHDKRLKYNKIMEAKIATPLEVLCR
jgi:casein kinase 1 epsilon